MGEAFAFLLGVAIGALLSGSSTRRSRGCHVNHGPVSDKPDLPESAQRPSKTKEHGDHTEEETP